MSNALDNAHKLLNVIDWSSPRYGAKRDGSADASAAINDAMDEARELRRLLVPSQGIYRCDQALDPTGCSIWTPASAYTRETTDFSGRGVTLLHNGDDPLYVPSGPGWSVEGVVHYDPNQPGTGTAPVERPGLIRPASDGDRPGDFTFENNVVVNAYDFFDLVEGSLGGDIRVVNNRIYAIRYLFWLKAVCPEAFIVTDNLFTAGIYQSKAVFFNSAMLLKWSCANGASWAIDVPDGGTVDGMKSTNNLYYGTRAVFQVDSGRITVSTCTGDNFDAVDSVILTRDTGAVTGMTISGGSVVSLRHTGGTRTHRTRAFLFTGSGDIDVSIKGTKLEQCDGDWFVDDSTGTSRVKCDSDMGPFALASGLTGDAYGVRINNPDAEYTLRLTKVRSGGYADAIGISVAQAAEVLISGTPFNGLKTPIVFASTIDTANSRFSVTGNMSRNTLGAKSLQADSAVVSASIVRASGNSWDEATDVADA